MDGEEHPFETATVARIYLAQGLLDQAESLFRRLLVAAPDCADLRAGLQEVRHRRQAELALQVRDKIAVDLQGSKLRCRWDVTADGRGRAARLLGQEQAQLVLRVVAFPLDPERPLLDLPLQRDQGKRTVDAPEGARLLVVSVGLLGADASFVSVAHSETVKL